MTPDPTAEDPSYRMPHSSKQQDTCGMQPGAGHCLSLIAGLLRCHVHRELTLPLEGGRLTAALQVPVRRVRKGFMEHGSPESA